MTEYDVKRLALIMAVQTEVEAMKIANEIRKMQDLSPAYDEEAFMNMSEKLEELAYKHDEQL